MYLSLLPGTMDRRQVRKNCNKKVNNKVNKRLNRTDWNGKYCVSLGMVSQILPLSYCCAAYSGHTYSKYIPP